MAKKATKKTDTLNLEAILFKCRDILRQAKNSGSFFEKRDMMLTLVFLRFMGEKYEDGVAKLRQKLIDEGLDPDDEEIIKAFFDDVTFADGTFDLPVEARWSTIINTAAPQLNVALDTEAAGYDADEMYRGATVIPVHSYSYNDEGSPEYSKAAESFIPANELTEEQRIDVLRKSIIKMMNHGGYRASDKTFCKQRHWIAVYRITADEGFTIDGDFHYFKHIVDGMELPTADIPLKEDTLAQTIKGVYASSFADWKSDGLSGRRLNEYNDIHHCAEVFAKILAENRPRKIWNG